MLVLGDDLASHSMLPSYFLFTLSDFLAFTAIYIPYTHLPPLAKAHGVSAGDAAFLISVGGIANTVGRFVGGWLSDKFGGALVTQIDIAVMVGATIGVGVVVDQAMDAEKPDVGRFSESGVEADTGAFKTPTIRNVAMTAPYMHDGSLATLLDVVEHYNKGGSANPHLSDKVQKLELTDQEKQDLVAFMEACTGDLPKVATDRLPQ